MSTNIKEIPSKFRTSDGEEFTHKADAERHEALVSARREYEEARHRYGLALAATQRTADGYPFQFRWESYYYIRRVWLSRPELAEVRFYGYDFDFNDREGFVIMQWENRHTDRQIRADYRVSELYFNKTRAQEALLAAQEEWLAEQAKEVATLRARVQPTPEAP